MKEKLSLTFLLDFPLKTSSCALSLIYSHLKVHFTCRSRSKHRYVRLQESIMKCLSNLQNVSARLKFSHLMAIIRLDVQHNKNLSPQLPCQHLPIMFTGKKKKNLLMSLALSREFMNRNNSCTLDNVSAALMPSQDLQGGFVG